MQNKWNPIHSLAYKKFISYLLVYKCIPDIFCPTYIRTGQKVIVHTPEMLKKSENKKLRKKMEAMMKNERQFASWETHASRMGKGSKCTGKRTMDAERRVLSYHGDHREAGNQMDLRDARTTLSAYHFYLTLCKAAGQVIGLCWIFNEQNFRILFHNVCYAEHNFV